MREHRQSWRDIFRGFRVALDARKMILGMFGIYLTAVVLLGIVKLASCYWPGVIPRLEQTIQSPTLYAQETATLWANRFATAMAHPFRGPSAGPGYLELLFLFGTGVVLLAIWSLVGGAITRLAAVDFAKDERLSLAEGFSFAGRKFGSFFWSPLVPLIFVAIFLCCNAVLGLVGRIPGIGPLVVGLCFWLAALSSFLVVLILIGECFGFLFMWPTVAMEGTDAFDAISRSFAYLFSRPWKTIWCWLVAVVYGTVCTAFVVGFTFGLLKITQWSVALGMAGEARPILSSLWTWGIGADAGWPEAVAMILMRVVFIMAWGLLLGFVVSFDFSAMTIIYAVLRRDVDGTDMAEVFLPEPQEPAAAPEPEQAVPEAPSEPAPDADKDTAPEQET
ncbi:MAG: hypothetical protein ISS78_02935 [Phycisphaerae bacterium]|nr:hypothetical protein [Phycisphaerae bacterium]